MSAVDKRDFPQLDAMRAAASIAVVATHTGFWSGVYNNGLLGSAAQRLEVGVAIFFVLSGFLLGRPYVVATLTDHPHDNAQRYARKRALRILPVYWVCVVAALTLMPANRGLGIERWFQSFLLIDLYRAQQLPQGLSQMWSLSVEVAFYLILPVAGALMVRCFRRQPGRLLLALAAVSALSIAWVALTHLSSASWAVWATRWLPSYLTWFAIGIGLAVFSVDALRTARLTSPVVALASDRTACWISAAAVFVLVSTPLGGSPLLVAPTAGQALTRHVLYAAIALLVVAPCVLGPADTRVAAVLSMPAVRHVGHLSYSLFCCHVLVLYLVAPRLGFELFQSSWPVLFIVILAISLTLSELLYRCVELPFLRWKTGSPWKTSKASAPSEIATHH